MRVSVYREEHGSRNSFVVREEALKNAGDHSAASVRLRRLGARSAGGNRGAHG
jgi:hypothetical protein